MGISPQESADPRGFPADPPFRALAARNTRRSVPAPCSNVQRSPVETNPTPCLTPGRLGPPFVFARVGTVGPERPMSATSRRLAGLTLALLTLALAGLERAQAQEDGLPPPTPASAGSSADVVTGFDPKTD